MGYSTFAEEEAYRQEKKVEKLRLDLREAEAELSLLRIKVERERQ